MKSTLLLSVALSFLVSTLWAKPAKKIIPAQIKKQVDQTQYDKVAIKKIPWASQCWTFRKFTFYETLEKANELGIKNLQAYSKQVLSRDNPDIKFNHELSDDQIKAVKKKLKEHKISVVAYGVVRFENNEAAMRKVFDFAKKMRIRCIVTEPKYDDFSLIDKMAQEYDMLVAIHNHPEPSKYAHPATVLDLIKDCSPRIGVCGDTGHWMRCKIKPVHALRMLKGRLIDVHFKDLDKYHAKKAVDVPFGTGKANIRDILAELTLQNYHGYLTIEHENKKEADNPVPPIKKGMAYVDSISTYQEILSWNKWKCSKHGWNHYGPGYFELDEKTGILKSHGGMGLFWYGEKKYGDFVLDLEFMCSDKKTNSGVFFRVPGFPVNNDYIHHSFEIQINEKGSPIHRTGAVYDAEPPSKSVAKPAGEWNRMKIRLKGKHINVELNGEQIIDWDMEPRGKVRDFADRGYIGLQNHDHRTSVSFRNILVKEL